MLNKILLIIALLLITGCNLFSDKDKEIESSDSYTFVIDSTNQKIQLSKSPISNVKITTKSTNNTSAFEWFKTIVIIIMPVVVIYLKDLYDERKIKKGIEKELHSLKILPNSIDKQIVSLKKYLKSRFTDRRLEVKLKANIFKELTHGNLHTYLKSHAKEKKDALVLTNQIFGYIDSLSTLYESVLKIQENHIKYTEEEYKLFLKNIYVIKYHLDLYPVSPHDPNLQDVKTNFNSLMLKVVHIKVGYEDLNIFYMLLVHNLTSINDLKVILQHTSEAMANLRYILIQEETTRNSINDAIQAYHERKREIKALLEKVTF
ncbi:hypothetical protein WAF17_02420 [Bernardetia sp. ABR2-2B]|uniref:hypothetical protein n=1 Tax=Bernardetia sp. ABR2-2B TaxID=3127472 RepID=UPI0030CAE859